MEKEIIDSIVAIKNGKKLTPENHLSNNIKLFSDLLKIKYDVEINDEYKRVGFEHNITQQSLNVVIYKNYWLPENEYNFLKELTKIFFKRNMCNLKIRYIDKENGYLITIEFNIIIEK